MKNKYLVKIITMVIVVSMFISMMMLQPAQAATNKYYIKVNKGTNVVTVYKSDGTPYKAFLASCGGATPTGTFYTKAKYRWKELIGPSYGQYSTRITGSILFHSVWYYKNGDKSSQSIRQYNRLGSLASHGCVRLTVGDAKWIYDNCPTGTKVIIFKGSSKKDPLGKPHVEKINSGKKMGWDPTDPDKKNPYNKITFKGVEEGSSLVHVGTTVNIKKDVKVVTKAGNSLTSKMKVRIKMPGSTAYKSTNAKTKKLSKRGTYVVEYSVKDSSTNRSKKITIKYIVKDIKAPSISGTSSDKTVQYKSKIDIKSNVRAKNATGKDLTSKISILLKRPGEDYKKFTDKAITFDKIGTYKVQYKVTNPNNDKTAKKTVAFICVDKKEPVIIGAKNSSVVCGEENNLLKDIKAKSYAGVDLTKRIQVKVEKVNEDNTFEMIEIKNNILICKDEGKYRVTYTVKNDFGAKKSVVIYIKAHRIIEPSPEPSLEPETELSPEPSLEL